jgi:hypothetical protein
MSNYLYQGDRQREARLLTTVPIDYGSDSPVRVRRLPRPHMTLYLSIASPYSGDAKTSLQSQVILLPI